MTVIKNEQHPHSPISIRLGSNQQQQCRSTKQKRDRLTPTKLETSLEWLIPCCWLW